MKHFSQFIFGLMASGLSIVTASTVTDLTADTFDDFVTSHAVVMVEFFAPWCAICQELEPIFDATANMLDSTKDIEFARVDCVADKELCDKYRTPIYPTLRLFQGRQQSIYNGKRIAEEMISYAERRYKPAVATLARDEIDDFSESDDVVVIGYWDVDDQASNETFVSVANEHLDYYTFGASNDPNAARAAGVTQPSIVLHKRYDEKVLAFKETFEEEAITDFVIMSSIPLLGEYSQKWSWTYFGEGTLPFAGIFANTSAERKKLASVIRPVAPEFTDVIRFATVDSAVYNKLASKFGIGDRQAPTVAIRDLQDRKFVMPAEVELTESSLRQWVEDWRNEKLEPYVKPEPAISEVTETDVIVVTADNFNEVVINNDADVVVEFYAPWCGHCKRLAPIYAELATLYAQHDKKIRIAKVDSTAHEIPGHEVKSYPTIKFFPAGGKDAAEAYKGGRTLEDFAKFLQENSVNKVDVLNASQKHQGDVENELIGSRQTGTAASDEL